MIENALLVRFKNWKTVKLWFVFLLCCATLNITACDYVERKLYPDFRAKKTKTPIEEPPFVEAKNRKPTKSISIEKVRDIADNAVEQSPTDFTVNPVALNNVKEKPKEEVIDNKLFSAPVTTNQERFDRLESHVQRLSLIHI